ncbi:MAG: alpha/beta hydrolase [Bacteroidales bacterium]|nr:alpha/beta hydrolase [Bacteroidales bacterium]
MNKKWMLLMFCFVALWLTAQEQNVVLTTPTGNLEGTLLLPEKPKKVSLVVLISGSGPTDRDGNNPQMKNNSLKLLAEALCHQGIATLRFDKRGVAESTMALDEEANIRFETYISDVEAWVAWAAKNNRIKDIFIAGHSEGSLIGMVAARKSPDIKGFISLSGAGFPADVVLRQQLQKQMPPEYFSQVDAMIDTLKSGKLLTNVPAEFFVLFRNSVQPYLISWFRFDPQREIATLKMPVLIINGGRDIQVDVDNLEALQAALPSAESVIFPTMNHLLKNCCSLLIKDQLPTYNDPVFPINETLVDVIVGFIHRNK